MADADDAPKLPAPLAALFADGGSGRALPVALPAGRLVWPDPRDRSDASAVTGPAYWLSDGSVTATRWAGLRADHRRSGLWPLLLEGLDHEPARPWLVGEVDPEPVSDVDEHGAAGFFAKRWAAMVRPPNDEWLQNSRRSPASTSSRLLDTTGLVLPCPVNSPTILMRWLTGAPNRSSAATTGWAWWPWTAAPTRWW